MTGKKGHAGGRLAEPAPERTSPEPKGSEGGRIAVPAKSRANDRSARRSSRPRESASKAKDDADAEKWYRKAAERGLAEAQNNLGLMYVLGRGVPQDDSAAVKWFRRAAQQGYAPARSNLSELRRQGRGGTT